MVAHVRLTVKLHTGLDDLELQKNALLLNVTSETLQGEAHRNQDSLEWNVSDDMKLKVQELRASYWRGLILFYFFQEIIKWWMSLPMMCESPEFIGTQVSRMSDLHALNNKSNSILLLFIYHCNIVFNSVQSWFLIVNYHILILKFKSVTLLHHPWHNTKSSRGYYWCSEQNIYLIKTDFPQNHMKHFFIDNKSFKNNRNLYCWIQSKRKWWSIHWFRCQ